MGVFVLPSSTLDELGRLRGLGDRWSTNVDKYELVNDSFVDENCAQRASNGSTRRLAFSFSEGGWLPNERDLMVCRNNP